MLPVKILLKVATTSAPVTAGQPLTLRDPVEMEGETPHSPASRLSLAKQYHVQYGDPSVDISVAVP